MTTISKNSAKPSDSGTTSLFNNPLLEKLTRTHFAVPIAILTSAALFVLYWGYTYTALNVYQLITLFFTGWFVFTFVEYMVHRHIFHMLPTSKFKEYVAYKFHGVHHDFPKDKSRLAMPPLFSTILSILLFLFFKLIMGDYAFGFMPGFLIGYTSYLYVHYIVHAYQPPNNFLKVLWVNHGIHHYKDHERAFGVSSPLWDFVFRTLPKRKKK